MAETDPRIRKLRRAGVGVLIGLAVVSVPLGVHIIETRTSPELWLSLLGAVFMMVLICLYALETALAPIPARKIRTPIIPSQHETIMQEQTVIDEPPEVEQKTEMIEPEVFIHDPSGEDSEVVSLVEVEEIPTHPPFQTESGTDMSELVTEQNGPTKNPDGPVLTVPTSTALRNPGLATEEAPTESDEDKTL